MGRHKRPGWWRVFLSSWGTEFWLNLRYSPMRLTPCAHPAKRIVYWHAGGEYVCERCGSSSGGVQRKGREAAPVLQAAEGQADA
jgi:hypothetical protein